MTFAAAAFVASPTSRSILSKAPLQKVATTRALNAAAGFENCILDATTALSSSSQTILLASAATTSTVYSATHSVLTTTADLQQPPQTQELEPILPDTTALLGVGAVAVVSAIATWVWANQVVPNSRTKLAMSKRQGSVKEYLDQLEKDTAAPAAVGEEDSSTITSSSSNHDGRRRRQFEQWLFTDWLEQRNATATTTPGRRREAALPILKQAKWNSGDNPVLAATGLILLGVIFAAITERVSTLFS